MIKMIRKSVKSPLSKTKIRGIDYVINHYLGCEHACLYCYAKFYCKKSYGKWGEWIVIRENIPKLLIGKRIKRSVLLSSLSDPYQPIEFKEKLTRRILEVLDKKAKVYILTKSDMVLRDIDLFKQFKDIEIGLTINSWDKKLKRILEPKSPEINKRIDALKILNEYKIKNYAFISPVIPELTDIELIIKEVKSFVDKFYFEFLNFKKSGEKFRKFIKEKYPEVYKILSNKEEYRKFQIRMSNLIKSFDIHIEKIIFHF